MKPARDAKRHADLLWQKYKEGKLETADTKSLMTSHEYDMTAALINLRKNGYEDLKRNPNVSRD